MSEMTVPSTTDTTLPWLPREGEPAVAYSAFLHWLQHPMHVRERRSMAQFAQDLSYNDGGNTMRTYRREWGWDERAAAWETHLLAVHASEVTEMRLDAARSTLAATDKLLEVALTALANVDPKKITVAEARNLVKAAADIRTQLLGSLEPAHTEPLATVRAVTQHDAEGNATSALDISFNGPKPPRES